MPAAAEGFIELHQGDELVPLGRGQFQFGGEELAVGVQHGQEGFEPAFKAFFSRLGIIMIALDQGFLLLPEFLEFGMGDEAVGDFPEGLAHGELVEDQGLFLLGLGGPEDGKVVAGDGPAEGLEKTAAWYKEMGWL